MKIEERPDGSLWITRLPLEELAFLSLAAPFTPDCRRVLEALLAGRRVVLTHDASEHRQYRRTAPRAVYQKFTAMEREVHALGVSRPTARESGGRSGCW